jgi:hypothetical protein
VEREVHPSPLPTGKGSLPDSRSIHLGPPTLSLLTELELFTKAEAMQHCSMHACKQEQEQGPDLYTYLDGIGRFVLARPCCIRFAQNNSKAQGSMVQLCRRTEDVRQTYGFGYFLLLFAPFLSCLQSGICFCFLEVIRSISGCRQCRGFRHCPDC